MRLINADALEEQGWIMHRTVVVNPQTMEVQTKKPTDFPTIIDAVPVVRCKDCVYWRHDDCQNDNHGFCPINENDFCSWGSERKGTKNERTD